jgi:hypothetical protein
VVSLVTERLARLNNQGNNNMAPINRAAPRIANTGLIAIALAPIVDVAASVLVAKMADTDAPLQEVMMAMMAVDAKAAAPKTAKHFKIK